MRILPNIDPRRLKRWLIALGAIYLLFPRDLVPDWLGRGLGYVDDATILAALTYFYRKQLREFAARAARAGAGAGGPGRAQQETSSQGAGSGASAPPSRSDPYAVLGVARGASVQEIEAAYRARMQEYHPDKVAHLGRELQELAHRKVLEIQEARRLLRG